jgi:hypothetical protein
MKSITVTKQSGNQPAFTLWTPLPECQQEMLSGGAPKIRTPPPPGGGGNPPTGGLRMSTGNAGVDPVAPNRSFSDATK